MSVTYAPVKWNRNKVIYDRFILLGITIYLVLFLGISSMIFSGKESISFPILLMRAFGTCALVMLHLLLCIGPLARLDKRFLPLVYNRRHLGVAIFLVALGHGFIAFGFYHGFGIENPFSSELTANTSFASLTRFPFELLGLFAFGILFVMAASSHDFWQKNLGASFWKSIHMLVYPAYAALILHVALGALQTGRSPIYVIVLGLGILSVTTLHLVTGWKERRKESSKGTQRISLDITWLDVGSVDEIVDGRAKVVCLPNRERVAIFRNGNRISAITNVCAHQRGPLGEGKIVDGCITCPWHGWDYRPEDGCAPPPFTEKVTTFAVRVQDRRILLNPSPNPLGTRSEPACFEECWL